MSDQKKEPDYIYDANEWEVTYEWADRGQMVEDLEYTYEAHEKPVKVGTLFKGPDKWFANIVLTRDEDGDPDETEVQWFDSEEDALAAIAANPRPPC